MKAVGDSIEPVYPETLRMYKVLCSVVLDARHDMLASTRSILSHHSESSRRTRASRSLKSTLVSYPDTLVSFAALGIPRIRGNPQF